MADIQITVDAKDVLAAMQRYPKRAAQATARGLNRGIGTARTVLTRLISKDLRLKQSDIREKFKLTNATTQHLVATLKVPGKPRLPLILFVTGKPPEPSRGKGQGVTYNVGKGRGRAPHAFIATVGKGRHRGVFERLGKQRLPIYQLHGPSLGQVAEVYEQEALTEGRRMARKNLLSGLKWAGSMSDAT